MKYGALRRKRKKGCFRRLRGKYQVIIISFHALTLLLPATILGFTIYATLLWGDLVQKLEGYQNEAAQADDIENSIYTGVALRVLVTFLGFYSVKTRHSPVIVMALTAMILVTSLMMLVAGIAILVKYQSIAWVQILLETHMEKMEFNKKEHPFIKKIQSEMKCCGTTNYTDWQLVPYGITSLRVPPSCCLPEKRFVNQTEDKYCGQNILPEYQEADRFIYTGGCLPRLTQKLLKILKTIAGFCLLSGILDACLVTFGVHLVLKDYV